MCKIIRGLGLEIFELSGIITCIDVEFLFFKRLKGEKSNLHLIAVLNFYFS